MDRQSDRHRMAWLATAPVVAGAAALVLGAATAATAAVVVTPYDGSLDVSIAEAGRALLSLTLGDLDDPLRLLPVAVGVVVAGLTWSVGLGLGAQALFPRRRRLLPAAAAVLLSALAGWVAIGVLAVGQEAREITVGRAAAALVLTGLAMAAPVYPLAGHRWRLTPQVARRPGPRPAARPAGLP